MTDNKQPEASELVREGEALRLLNAAFGEYACMIKAKLTKSEIGEFERNFAVPARKWIAAFNPARLEALSSQQPAPKDEPQRQGGESDLTNGSGAWEYTRERTNYGGLGITLRDFGLHGWEAWHMYDASGDCLFVLFKRRIASRPATVVDDAAIQRACIAWNEATSPRDTEGPMLWNPYSASLMRAALLAAFP